MPIKGLTDRGLAFAQIGVIRKGAPKSANKPGADLKYFRVEFDEAEQESAARFREVYGDTPTKIRVVFPFDDIDQIASFWLEAYTAGRMVARSDGEIYIYKVDMKTGEVLVKDGKDIKTGQPVPYVPGVPEGTYRNRNTNRDEPVYCKQVGRIRVVVPELKRYAYLLLMTTSINDIKNLSEQLYGIWEGNKHHIAGIRFILQRKPRKVSCPDPSDKTRRVRYEKWMLSIEPDPEWVEKKLLAMRADSLRFEAPRPVAALTPGPTAPARLLTAAETSGDAWDTYPPVEEFSEGDEELEEGEYYEDGAPETESQSAAEAPAPTLAPEITAPPPLRLQPDALKAHIAKRAKEEKVKLTDDSRKTKTGLIVQALESVLSMTTNPKESRHQLQAWLIGKDSLTDVDDTTIAVLYAWLKPAQDTSGEWIADAMAAREAVAAFNACQPNQDGLFN